MNRTVFTAGVFDLFHAGHMESIMKIFSLFPDRKLIIGVASDKYTESFKRVPFQTLDERMHTVKSVFASLKNVEVIVDPLSGYMDSYEEWFYDKYGITDHCQGADFDENPKVYEYIKSIGGLHIMGRSKLMSTTELINKLSPTKVFELSGDTNQNYRIGNITIKKIVHGNSEFIDGAYGQLLEQQAFGITSYQRHDDLVFIPYVEGSVTPDISMPELSNIMDEINNSGIKPTITILDVFKLYDYIPDAQLYGHLLLDMTSVSHGDMAYTNVVKGQLGINPIDWENLCYAMKDWDAAPFLVSLFIYGHRTFEQIKTNTEELALLRKTDAKKLALLLMLVCDYWLQWNISTGYEYFPNELKELRSNLNNYMLE